MVGLLDNSVRASQNSFLNPRQPECCLGLSCARVSRYVPRTGLWWIRIGWSFCCCLASHVDTRFTRKNLSDRVQQSNVIKLTKGARRRPVDWSRCLSASAPRNNFTVRQKAACNVCPSAQAEPHCVKQMAGRSDDPVHA